MPNKLAINGGPPVRIGYFPNQSTIGPGEIDAAYRVLNSGNLTGYKGNAGDGFLGGPEIRALEKEWSDKYTGRIASFDNVKQAKESDLPEAIIDIDFKKLHCIPINSCTSGLFVACGAIGIQPGDEVIVTPYSMTCSATAPMVWGGVPIFADIDPNTFNLDPDDVERKITPRTKAIIVVDLFGLPYDKRIDVIAKKHNLKVIEDAAQAVGARREGHYAGTLGHIGVFSFNLGKHLTCGEGGMICTYDEDLAMRCRLLMNHGEAVINDHLSHGKVDSMDDVKEKIACMLDYSDVFGFNLRLTEINAAIVRVQLLKMDDLIEKRLNNVNNLLRYLSEIVPAIELIKNPKGYSHTYYVLPIKFVESEWGIHRNKVVEAVKAELMPCDGRIDEGVTIGNGYIKPIWRMPVFATKYPLDDKFSSPTPVCDRMWRDELIIMHRFFGPNAENGDMGHVADAFKKVWKYKDELK